MGAFLLLLATFYPLKRVTKSIKFRLVNTALNYALMSWLLFRACWILRIEICST